MEEFAVMLTPSVFSLIRTKTDRFPRLDLVFSDYREMLCRRHNIFQRRAFSFGVHFAEILFEEVLGMCSWHCWNSTVSLYSP